jgi:hypothetical protein
MMWMRGTVAAVLLAGLAGAAWADTVEVQRIEVFLVQGHSGTLSADILPPKQTIGFWNTIIGEGGAGEGSEDVLVVVHYRRLKQTDLRSQTLFSATDEFGKLVLKRENFDLWFGDGEKAAKAFLLEQITCRHVKLEVSVDGKAERHELPFQCGE